MNKPLGGAGGGGGGGNSPPDILQDNLLSKDVVEFTLGVCEGPIGGLVAGGRSFYLDDTPLLSNEDQPNFEPFQLHLYHGSEEASQIRNVLGGATSSQQVGVVLSPNSPVVRVTPSALSNQIDQLEVRLKINSLVTSTDTGDQLNADIDFKIEFRPSGTTEWLNFKNPSPRQPVVTSYGLSAGGGLNLLTPNLETPTGTDFFRITGKTTGGYIRDFVKKVPRISGDWDIRVTLLSETNDPMISRSMSFESIQSVTTEPRAYANLAVVRGLGQASDQLGSIPSFTGIFAGLLVKVPSNFDPVTRHYSGLWDGTFKIAHTDDPAWVLYDLCDHPVHGLRKHLPDLVLNRYSFYEASQWCNQLVPRPGGGFQPRYTYNGAKNQISNGIELITYVASSFNAVFLSDMNGSIRVAVDKPTPLVQLFGPESVGVEGFQYQFTDIMQRYNDIEVEFINPDLGWEPDRRRVFDQALIDKNGSIPLKMTAIGCNNIFEAQRRATLRLIQANTELATVSFQTTRAGISLDLFDLIGISDPDMLWGVSGRVKAVVEDVIHLRDTLTLPENTPLEMIVQTATGPVSVTVQTENPVTKTLTMTTPWPENAPEKAQFAITSAGDLGLVKPFRIVAIKPNDDDPEAIMITAIEVNINKYGDADGTTSLGTIDYSGQSNRLPQPPVITYLDSGTAQLVRMGNTLASRIRLEWELDRASFIRETEIHYRRAFQGEFQKITSGSTQAYITDVQDGEIVELYLVSVTHNGGRSVQTPLVAHRVVGKTAPPAPITGLTAKAAFGSIRLSWDQNTEMDFNYHEILAGPPGFEVNNAALEKYQFAGNEFVRSGLSPLTTLAFRVRTTDTSGNRSGWSEEVQATSLEFSPDARIGRALTIAEQVEAELEAAQIQIDAALDDAQAAGLAAQSVRADHDALVEGFLGNLSDLNSEVVSLSADVGDVAGAVTDILGLDISPESALAVSLTTLSASVGDLESEITLQGSAIADLQGAASAGYLIKVQAGGAVSLLDLVAADDGVTPPTSVARISADDILLDGTVSTEKLVVGTGKNLLENANWRAGTTGWRTFPEGSAGAATSFSIRSNDSFSSDAAPTAVLIQGTSETTGHIDVESRPLVSTTGADALGYPVTPGETIEASVQMSAHRCVGELRVIFFDGNENLLSLSPLLGENNSVQSSETNPDLWPRAGGRTTVPAGAVSASIHVRKNATLPGFNDSYLFLHKPMLCFTHASATQLTRWSPPGTTLIDGGQVIANSITGNKIVADEALFNKLKAQTGWIGGVNLANGAVDASKIVTNSLTLSLFSSGVLQVPLYPVGVDIIDSTRTFWPRFNGLAAVYVIGGGGGGGAAADKLEFNGAPRKVATGGGAGGLSIAFIPNLSTSNAYTAVVGSAGAGGFAQGHGWIVGGDNGGASHFYGHGISAYAHGGGQGYAQGNTGVTLAGGNGGYANSGNYNFTGGGGGAARADDIRRHSVSAGGALNLNINGWNASADGIVDASPNGDDATFYGKEPQPGNVASMEVSGFPLKGVAYFGGGFGAVRLGPANSQNVGSPIDAVGGSSGRGGGGGGAIGLVADASQRATARGGSGGLGLIVVIYYGTGNLK